MFAFKTIVVCWLFFLGLQFGGFYNVYLYRVSSGTTLFETSRCPKCASAIPLWRLLPLFGWISLRGRCGSCRDKISVVYPLVEACCSALVGGIGWIAVASAPDFAAIERAIGTALWSGFVALYFIGAIVFSRRGVAVPWGLPLVAGALVALGLFPASFFGFPGTGVVFADRTIGVFATTTALSIAGILALSCGYELTGPRKKAFVGDVARAEKSNDDEKNAKN